LRKALAHGHKAEVKHLVLPVKVLDHAMLVLNAAEQLVAMRADGNWSDKQIVDYMAGVLLEDMED